ncbi:hypothetical protein [Halocatena pleomorpha]|uniref:Uncharacterized protein n=1 Tax=Halocatena pleomorpha TaxID=1785090 RepID=A0A3P3RLI3_9EURY|nr:hypothetical protein [Halocatena pleomorpha]RRJ34225.1 hypothetical protein EIK79_00130 [Halocatena pleomorpha]
MVGPLVAGKKAAEFGYKRYGLPGAIVAGVSVAIGTAIGIRKFKSVATTNDEPNEHSDSGSR